jgi:ADP-ribose pyrophosphatase YjhB (NUDIX family)
MPMSRFVAGLRALVGHELLHMPSACVLCHDPAGRMLLVRQAESGRWSVPGGVIEPGEAPDDAARREVLEETGIEVRITALRTAIGGPRCRTVYANGDRLSYVALVYEGEVVGDATPVPDGAEVDDTGWFRADEVAKLPLESFVEVLRDEGLLGDVAHANPA